MSDETAKKTRFVQSATLDWDVGDNSGGAAPRSILFDDIYFSGDGPTETAHVFIEGNDLLRRFQTAQQFLIGELGFGTGLNFLVTWRSWEAASKPPGSRLDFISFEKYPLSRGQMARTHQAWPDLADYADQLRAALPPPISGFHRARLSQGVFLTLFYGDAVDGLKKSDGEMDAWFLDGFSPAKNPEMWRPEIYPELARLSRAGATAATFTVAGDVRRGLSGAGFELEKRPGYGRKREMLTARISHTPPHPNWRPWFKSRSTLTISPGSKVAVVGGGIAGASMAFALKKYGFSPVVFDPAPASGASGNPAGLIMPRLDLGDTPAAQFFVQAYVTVVRLLNELNGNARSTFFFPCSVILGAVDENERTRHEKIIAENRLPSGWIEKHERGLRFPQSGTVDPKQLVQALLNGIETKQEDVAAIKEGNAGPTVVTERDRHDVAAVVITNSVAALKFAQTRTLPLTGVAGQLDYFPETPAPDQAIAAGPYAAPAPGGGLVIGATYDRLAHGETPKTTRAASEENIAAATALIPKIANALSPEQSQPRASLRCQTPDRLPIAGPLPDWGFYSGAYDGLRQGKQLDYPRGEMQPGIFILSGLGSRGFVTAPLCAEIIASSLTGAPSPVSREVTEALHPARFFIRDLKRKTQPGS